MLRTTARIASLSATLLLACAALASEPSGPQATNARSVPTSSTAVKGHAIAVATSPVLLPAARDAGARALAFLSNVSSTAAFTPAGIGHAMGVTLGPDPSNDPGWAVYHSPDIGHGWTYWVQFAAGEATMKPGFRFWFDHSDRAADAAPVCSLPLDQVRRTLAAHGWTELQLPSELGGIRAIEFTRGDVVLTLTPRDGADVNGTACVLSLQTSDGRPTAPQRSPAAILVTQRLTAFLTDLTSSETLTTEMVGQEFGVKLAPEEGQSAYRSTDLAGGWSYGVAVSPANQSMKRGFAFWFYNPQKDADATPICVLSLDALGRSLTAHGFVERVTATELGGPDWVDFVKGDVVITITDRDLLIAPNGDECFGRLQTTDGR